MLSAQVLSRPVRIRAPPDTHLPWPASSSSSVIWRLAYERHTRDLLDSIGKALLRSDVLGYLLLIIWFGAFALAGDVIYDIHGALFGMTPRELNLIHYCGMAFVRLCVLVFFLCPYLSVRMVLRKKT